MLKNKIKLYTPAPILNNAKRILQSYALRRSGVIDAFGAAIKEPRFLSLEDLRTLANEYPPPAEKQISGGYSDAAIIQRAHVRRDMIKKALKRNYSLCRSFLEVGAADAMVARALLRDGKKVLATDIQDKTFDHRAKKDRVPFKIWSATALQAEDNSFDVLYSFDSMEHISDPETALAEAVRVVRPGGYIYLRFGPLYWSPYGMHLGSRLGVPYASVLFENKTIDTFVMACGRGPINHDHCNGWSLIQFRNLFCDRRDILEKRAYYEHWDLSGLDLIKRFPSCFRSKSEDIESFLVGVLEGLFQKK